MNFITLNLGRRFVCRLFFCLCGLATLAGAFAQSGATGRIVGRVFNPATQTFVRNAEVTIEGTFGQQVVSRDWSWRVGPGWRGFEC